MSACTECGATHNDACTYSLCPRRKLNRSKNTQDRNAHRFGFTCALCVSFFHEACNALN